MKTFNYDLIDLMSKAYSHGWNIKFRETSIIFVYDFEDSPLEMDVEWQNPKERDVREMSCINKCIDQFSAEKTERLRRQASLKLTPEERKAVGL